MRHITRFWLPALAALVGLASTARAQVTIRVPFVSVQVGGGVYVRAPFVRVAVPGYYGVPASGSYVVPTPVMPATEVLPPPRAIGDPIPVPIPQAGQTDFSVPVPLPRSTRPQTPQEFTESFKPAAGSYDVVLLHPVTNKPVQVNFTLPEGSARKVRTFPRQINFDYDGRHDVTIRFLADGRVRVTN